MPEPAAVTVSAADFARGFERFRHQASTVGVIEVVSQGHVVGGYLSAAELAHYRRLRRQERDVFVVGQLPDDLVADIEAARYGVAPE